MAKRKMTTIEKIEKIVEEKQCRKIDGMLVDLYTASTILSVRKGLNETNRARLESLDIDRMCSVALKCAQVH